MKCKFFKVSALNPMDDEQLFNQFCHQHRIVNTEKHFVAKGAVPLVSWLNAVQWPDSNIFCVEF